MRRALLLLLVLAGCVDPNAMPDAAPIAAHKAMITHIKDDSDYSSDAPVADVDDGSAARRVSFAETMAAVSDHVAQGQGGHYGAYGDFAQAVDCTAKLAEAQALVAPCAAELLAQGCGSEWMKYKDGECPQCSALEAADAALVAGKCPARATYPMLRN